MSDNLFSFCLNIFMAIILLAFILLVTLLINFSIVMADEIPIQVIVYKAPDAKQLNDDQAYKAFTRCRKTWNQTFPEHKLKLTEFFDERVSHAPSLKEFEKFYIVGIEKAYKEMKAWSLHLGFMPALLDDNGVWYFGGLGTPGHFGSRELMAAVFAAPETISGKNGVYRAAWIACHEIGHNFGARHDDGENLMNLAPASFIDDTGFVFSDKSQREIRRTFRRIK